MEMFVSASLISFLKVLAFSKISLGVFSSISEKGILKSSSAISNNIERSKINLERLKFQYEQEKLNLENTVNVAYNDLVGAIKFYEASNKTVKSLQSAFEDASDRFLLGALNSFEFMQSKQLYEASVSENIRAKFDYIFRLKVLEFYFGLPLTIPMAN